VIVELLGEAVRQGGPGELTAALRVIGKNMPDLSPEARGRCLAAILDLCARPDANPTSRERALSVLNVLYPSLSGDERRQVRDALADLRERVQSPSLIEFFEQTVPQVDREAES
jgi:hypothetical protein